jgi:hypothetical protein
MNHALDKLAQDLADDFNNGVKMLDLELMEDLISVEASHNPERKLEIILLRNNQKRADLYKELGDKYGSAAVKLLKKQADRP